MSGVTRHVARNWSLVTQLVYKHALQMTYIYLIGVHILNLIKLNEFQKIIFIIEIMH